MKSTDQILSDAASLIRVHGHCKGNFIGPGGSFCAYGALSQASDSIPAYLEAGNALTDQIHDCVIPWNDAPERTAEDVIAALEGAANAIRSREGRQVLVL